MMADRELLLEVLHNLSSEEYRTFLFFLTDKRLDPPLSIKQTYNVSVTELVQTLEQVYTNRSLRVASAIFKKIKRNDLWEKLNEIPSDYNMADTCDFMEAPGRGDKDLDIGSTLHSQQIAAGVQETQRGNWPGVQETQKGNWPDVQETQRGNWFQEMTTVLAHRRKELPPKLVTDQQLMRLAKKIGKPWKEIGIEILGIENNKLDQIEWDNQNQVVMKTFLMFKAWKNKERKKATAERLYQLLSQDDVPIELEAYEFLNEYSE